MPTCSTPPTKVTGGFSPFSPQRSAASAPSTCSGTSSNSGSASATSSSPPTYRCWRRFARLREAGTEIVFVEGNHDFHLGPFFRETLGCRVLPDGGAVEIDGRRVYLAHGDLVDSTDRGYRLLRRLSAQPLVRNLVQGLAPPDLTWADLRAGPAGAAAAPA